MRKLALLSSVVLLSGCLKTWDQLRGENQDSTPQRQTAQQQAQQAAEKAPPAGYKFEEVDEQMRQLNGRLDTLENQVSQIHNAGTADKDNVNKLREAQDQKLLAYEEALKKLEAELLLLRQDVDRLKQPPPTKGAAPAATTPGRTAYDDGEELLAAKKWRESIVAYQKYRDTYPKGKQYADATYKMGVAFQELGMKDEARAFYEEVKEKFPSSKEAKKAIARMKSLK